MLAPPSCKHGHLLVGDNAARDARGNRICLACRQEASDRWRRNNPHRERASRARWKNANPEKWKQVALASKRKWRKKAIGSGQLFQGYTKKVMQSVGRERLEAAFSVARDTGSAAAVAEVIGSKSRWIAIRHFYPKIAVRMDQLRLEGRAARKIIKPARPAIIRMASLDLIARIEAAVPRVLARDHRQDVISDMIEAVLVGHVRIEAIAQHVNHFVRATFRTDHNKFGPLSLDLPAFREGQTPLTETISKGLWQ